MPAGAGPGGRATLRSISFARIDSPQEARLIDLMRNGDGTLSIFSTLLDHSAPASPPARERAREE